MISRIFASVVFAVLFWGVAVAKDTVQLNKASADLLQSCKLNEADPDRTIRNCTLALKLKLPPRFRAFLYYNIGNSFSAKAEFDKAIANYDEAIRVDPKYAEAYNNRGVAWEDKGEPERAIADFNESIRLNPKDIIAYRDRSTVWSTRGELDRAIEDLSTAISLSPKDGNLYAIRGKNWQLKGDLDRALADQDKAAALMAARKDESILVDVYRGDTLRYKGEFDRAILDYEAALRVQPDYIPAFTGLGLTYEKMGDQVKARAKFEQAASSQSKGRFKDVSKSSLETANARLAALDSGIAQPTIPNSLAKATSATSIPTPALSVPNLSASANQVATAKQGRRVALVIGNSAYKNVPVLPNPQKDAEAIAASLRNIGFDTVTLARDATRENLINSLRSFAEEADKADWAMVYYAGHGIEVNGQNYLIPVDAKLAADRDVQFEAVPLEQVLAALEGAKKLKLIMLDACRVNPFTPQMRKTDAIATIGLDSTAGGTIGTRSIGRGLGRVDVRSGPTLVVFAAKDGQTALDGDGANSPFAVAMVQRIATPGVEINKIFRLVRDDVMEATAGRQEPYTYGSLPGNEDFFFVAK